MFCNTAGYCLSWDKKKNDSGLWRRKAHKQSSCSAGAADGEAGALSEACRLYVPFSCASLGFFFLFFQIVIVFAKPWPAATPWAPRWIDRQQLLFLHLRVLVSLRLCMRGRLFKVPSETPKRSVFLPNGFQPE